MRLTLLSTNETEQLFIRNGKLLDGSMLADDLYSDCDDYVELMREFRASVEAYTALSVFRVGAHVWSLS